MNAKDLSLLIVDEDKTLRQLLAAFVNDRYRSVTAVSPEELRSLINCPAEVPAISGWQSVSRRLPQ